MLSGNSKIIAHIGWPTHSFKSSLIYNPWFEKQGIDACVVPMGLLPQYFDSAFPGIMAMGNVCGALITMPYKVRVLPLLTEVSVAVQASGACNAVRKRADGSLEGHQVDGAGFVRAALAKGQKLQGVRVLMSGCGGVGCGIAAALAEAGVAQLALFDTQHASAEALAGRLQTYYPQVTVTLGACDPDGFDMVINATPLGMNAGDALPFDMARIAPGTFIADVVMKAEHTPFLRAALDKGCRVQVGTDMLFEMIPAYLEYFDLGSASADELRAGAKIVY